MPKPKPKFDTSIIDVAEILESSAIQGIPEMVGLFGDALPREESAYDPLIKIDKQEGTPKEGTPDMGNREKRIPSGDTSDRGSPGKADPQTGTELHDTSRQRSMGSSEFSLGALAALGFTVDPPQLRAAVLAQDAHTQSEELLYGKMWAKGVPQPGVPCRILTIGLKKLTALVRMVKTDSCRNNLDGLIQKLAIEDLGVAPNPNHGHVYRIWDQGAILKRRRDNGLTHYYRMRRAVYLVNPAERSGVPFFTVPLVEESSGEAPQQREPNRGSPFYESRGPHSETPEKQTGVPSKGQTGVPSDGPRLIRNRNIQENVSRSELPEIVVDALLSVMGDCDDEAAKRIVTAARSARPEVPDQVIVQIIHMKGPRIRANTKLDYPLRVLEIALAETVRGITGANLCKAYSKATGTQGREVKYESILNDPTASEREKDLARRMIATASAPVAGSHDN